MEDNLKKELRRKFYHLPIFLAEKTEAISKAIGEVGPIEAEAVAMLLENYLEAIKALPDFSEEMHMFIKDEFHGTAHRSDQCDLNEAMKVNRLDAMAAVNRIKKRKPLE